jgi:hypothetical protein
MNARVVAISIILLFAIAVLLPFFVKIPAEEGSRREYVSLEDIEIKAERINESHADIKFLISIYRSKTVTNSSLVVSIYDMATNLLLKKVELQIPEKSDEGLEELNTTISFEKDKTYNIGFRLEKDKKIVHTRWMSLKGLDTLLPKDKELKMTLKDVDFQILNVFDNVTTIRARFYVEAMEDYDDAVFHVKAIQFESNVLADEKWMEVSVEKGKTLRVESNLTVPKDYNYLVKLEVWRNDALLKTWTKGLNLAPTKKVPENVTEEKVRFEVSQFVKAPKPTYTPTPLPVPTPTPPSKYAGELKPKAPGFEILLAVLTIGGAVLWRKRK